MRREKSAIFERRADAVAGFFNSSVGESNNSEMMHAGIEGVHFDFNELAFESECGGGKNLGRHMAHG